MVVWGKECQQTHSTGPVALHVAQGTSCESFACCGYFLYVSFKKEGGEVGGDDGGSGRCRTGFRTLKSGLFAHKYLRLQAPLGVVHFAFSSRPPPSAIFLSSLLSLSTDLSIPSNGLFVFDSSSLHIQNASIDITRDRVLPALRIFGQVRASCPRPSYASVYDLPLPLRPNVSLYRYVYPRKAQTARGTYRL